MYNFRYHLVTIVSIFAALVIGLLLGVALTGSDLVRDASSNLAQSLTAEFDELKTQNDLLGDQLQEETLFSGELLSEWQTDRLKGRTVAILSRNGESASTLSSTIGAVVSRSGGIPVYVTLEQMEGLNLDDELSASVLRQLVPEVEGEDYSLTVAKKLVEEWSFVARDGETNMVFAFEKNYPLTRFLVNTKRATITVDYQPVMDSLQQLGAVVGASTTLQLSAYAQAQRTVMPYGVNAVIDAAYHTSSFGSGVEADADVLRITGAFEAKGRRGELPYLNLSAMQSEVVMGALSADTDAIETGGTTGTGTQTGESSGTGDVVGAAAGGSVAENTTPIIIAEGDNYFTLVVSMSENADVAIAAAQQAGLACVFIPLESTGQYNIIALLTGAKKGIYGNGHAGVDGFAKIPTDKTGNGAFVKE